VTKKTWSTYKTAEIMLGKCSQETKTPMDLPLTESKILTFIDWLARIRGLKCTTINSYLAGIRQLHIITGLPAPVLRSDLVKLVLKGISNLNGIANRKKNWEGRLPMTLNSMLLFKTLIRGSTYPECDKALLWAVSTLAFAGAFRIHEILAKTESTFDPDFTLLTEDVTFSSNAGQDILHVRLKCPKESKTAAATIVDIYQNTGKICPIKAVKKWFFLKRREPGLPLFRFDNGTPLTGTKLNRIMKSLFSPHVNPDIGFFGTHSFRIGIASMLGQAGFEDQEIMDTSRWSSRVFERYLRLARTRRAAMQKPISHLPSLRK
jgi:integrase